MTISPLSSSSLMSLLGTTSSTGSTYGYGTSDVSATTQAILDQISRATGATSSSNGVSISTDARLAAAEAADNAKDFSVLATEVRQELDHGTTPMTGMSGRALAAVVLNQGNAFSSTEIAAAKQELDSRTRQDFTLTAGSGGTGGLAAYDQQLVSQYDATSDEEREARGWTKAMRDSAASFVTTSQATTTSLFDAIDAADSADGHSVGL